MKNARVAPHAKRVDYLTVPVMQLNWIFMTKYPSLPPFIFTASPVEKDR